MVAKPNSSKTSIIPSLRFADAQTGIEWLCMAFGFEKQLVVPGEQEGDIAHAQLTLGGAMIMLGSSSSHGGSAFSERVRPAGELAGRTNQSIYVVVEDPDGHCARATAAGAEILMDIEDQDYGGRGYTCLDLEGNVWSFGSYDPWNSDV
jgi:uncharacterized glyoxalase superfamily protein PhnB